MSGGASTSAGATNGGGSTAAGGVNGGGNSATACDKPAPPGNARVWRLTRTQIENTLRDNFGYVPPAIGSIPIEARLDGFANQAARLTISPLLAETFFTMGNELGVHAAQNPRAYGIACNVEQLAAGACLTDFLNSAGSKMWRRPLTDAEVSSLTTLFTSTSAQGGAAAAVASVLQALLLSPNFLHRTELGTAVEAGAVTQLTHHEIASALSFLLWDSGPDEELLSLARDSKLRDRETLLKQARRMFDRREKSEPAMAAFFQQWLYLERLPSTTKSTEHFSMATPEVASDLDHEFRLFLSSVLFEPGGDKNLKTLFTSTYSFVNERTAPLYGITGVTGTTLVRRDLNPAQRRGVISMVPFLWGHSNAEETNLVGRGAHFRSQLLCERLVLPPGGVPPGNFAPPNSTGRQKLTLHSSPGCAGCHALFDGIGFALEQYDAIGRFRTTEYDQTIDPSGTLPLPSENNAGDGLVFANFIELVDKLVEKPDIYSCFAQQFASYASGRDYPELDPCERETLIKQFVASNYKIDELVMNVIGSPSFIDRKN
jgi:hypothetical protein